ncbi:alkaline phosphatase D family protein [Marinicella sediminis]|uniref:Alkaline phosphatase D family protein n=1 Tax=Marinicella sediminis TaxID=1792834 RepID=A0ABV7J8R4_9GAMM|nr:alkaline phosphatase D family protein [Marinicella sediminis]
MNKTLLFSGFLLSTLASCGYQTKPVSEPLDVIAFGSCNKQDHAQTYWQHIQSHHPDLWIWLGDNIYADTHDMQVMQDKYQQQRNNPDYQQFVSEVPVIGTWDDHDYGMNDGNRDYAKKTAAKAHFMDFMNIPSNHPMAARDGIYHSRLYGQPPHQIKVILLDTRTFQDPLAKTPKGSQRNYVTNHSGSLLGDEQWQWLEKELRQSSAQINVVASSLQVVAEDHKYEMWANFPNERKRLLNLLVSSQANTPLILSGDRHLSEVSQIKWQGQLITDVTSSGLTHSFSGNWEENSHRVGRLITDESYSVLFVDWPSSVLTIQQLGMNQQLLNEIQLPLTVRMQ